MRLAHQHYLSLQREWDHVRLDSRRNAKGRYSERGHFFWFEVWNDEGAQIEYVLHFDYGEDSDRDLIRFQVHILGPSGTKDSEVIEIVRKRSQGEPWPKGWKKKAIYWQKPNSKSDTSLRTGPFPRRLRKTIYSAGEGKVVSRSTAIRRHRSTRKKRRKK